MFALPRSGGSVHRSCAARRRAGSNGSGNRTRRTLTQCPPHVLLRLGRPLPLLVSDGHGDQLPQNAPRRTHRAPALPGRGARARTCPAVAKPAQECPARTVALTVRGATGDNAARAVRHDGGPRSWGRAVVNGTRSASSLRAPGVRAARLQALAGFGLSRHGVSRPGDRRAASHLEQSGECQP